MTSILAAIVIAGSIWLSMEGVIVGTYILLFILGGKSTVDFHRIGSLYWHEDQ